MSNTLFRQVPGFLSVTGPVKDFTYTKVPLVSGDVNADGQINILDYNILTGCYGKKSGTASCLNKAGADLDDNDAVDGADYNIYLRNVGSQSGA